MEKGPIVEFDYFFLNAKEKFPQFVQIFEVLYSLRATEQEHNERLKSSIHTNHSEFCGPVLGTLEKKILHIVENISQLVSANVHGHKSFVEACTYLQLAAFIVWQLRENSVWKVSHIRQDPFRHRVWFLPAQNGNVISSSLTPVMKQSCNNKTGMVLSIMRFLYRMISTLTFSQTFQGEYGVHYVAENCRDIATYRLQIAYIKLA